VDAPHLARYPFVPQARNLVQEEGPPLGRLMQGHAWERARTRGRNRVGRALDQKPAPEVHPQGEHEALVEILGYVVARLVASCLDDNLATSRFALAEAERVCENLAEDPDWVLVDVAEALGIELEPREGHAWGVPFDDYLRASRELSAIDWKLVNRTMHAGTVLLERDEVTRLVQEAHRLRLMNELPLEVPSDVNEVLDPLLQPLEGRLTEIKAGREEVEMEQVEPDAFPPCIDALIQSIKSSENVSHEGRFAVVAFLNRIGMGREEIINELFPNVPDFAKDVTEYQVDHITGQKNKESYTPPGCSSMQTYGLCPMMGRAEEEWDDWCNHEKMNHPLTYYRWGLFTMEQRGEIEEAEVDDPEAEPDAEA